MPLDPSFRSRLREALQQSVAGRRSKDPAVAGPPCSEPVEAEGAAPERDVRRAEWRYESEEERQHRVDAEQSAWIADALGGWWNREAGGACLVVDRTYAGDRAHGDAEIGHYAETLSRYRDTLRSFSAAAPAAGVPTLFTGLDDDAAGDGSPAGDEASDRTPDPEPRRELVEGRTSDDDRLLFFDLETTGLSGGAGTCAFLIGYGWFEGAVFRTRQFFLSGFGHEAAMLRLAVGPLQHVTLASFNGKTFDVPLIGGRYLFHRLACPFDDVPHVDLLHPARRLWRHRPGDERPVDPERRDAFARYFRMTRSTRVELASPGWRRDLSAGAASCALGALEHAVLGFRRTDDVAGADIPTRYFHYIRTGDARPLVPVLEHNRLDLVSLAAVASVVARMLEEGPAAARNAHECLALGRLYERSGAVDRATACYEKAADGAPAASWRGDVGVEREALRRLAVRHRRDRRWGDAAIAWQRLLDLSSARATVDVEALHALAVHHEHRSKDLHAARALVVRAIEGTHDLRAGQALRHRLARIERKLSTGSRSGETDPV